jgi:hypothetical protein
LVGRSEGNMPLGKHGHRWEDNVKINHKKEDKITRTALIGSK